MFSEAHGGRARSFAARPGVPTKYTCRAHPRHQRGRLLRASDNPKFGKIICGDRASATKKFQNVNPTSIKGGIGKKLCGIFGNERLACWRARAIRRHRHEGLRRREGELVRSPLRDLEFQRRPLPVSGLERRRPVRHRERMARASDRSWWWRGGHLRRLGAGRRHPLPRAWRAEGSILVGSEPRLPRGRNHMCAGRSRADSIAGARTTSASSATGRRTTPRCPPSSSGSRASSRSPSARVTPARSSATAPCRWGANDHHQLANGTTLTEHAPGDGPRRARRGASRPPATPMRAPRPGRRDPVLGCERPRPARRRLQRGTHCSRPDKIPLTGLWQNGRMVITGGGMRSSAPRP